MSHSTSAARTSSPRITLAVAAATAIMCLLSVFALADAAVEHEGLARLDPQVAEHVTAMRNAPSTVAAHVLTLIGSEVVIGGLTLLALAFLFARRRLWLFTALAVAMAGSVFLTVAVKLAVARPRPGADIVLGPVDMSYSFPSGHTLNSAVFLAVLAVGLSARCRKRSMRVAVRVAALTLGAGIGLSRIYLGYHWMTDVLAAWLVALGWLSIVWILMSTYGSGAVPRIGHLRDQMTRR